MSDLLTQKVSKLVEILHQHKQLLVAFSGGVDSSYLLAQAYTELGTNVLGVIADSPSLPRKSLSDTLEWTSRRRIPVRTIKTEEFSNADYTSNPVNRCYFCKAELFSKLEKLAQELSFNAIAYGENADDIKQLRPGRKAAAEFKIVAPLQEAGLSKIEIRKLSASLGLPTTNIPAQPCLSSRIPHGQKVTLEALSMVEKAEEELRKLGFEIFRVRHHQPNTEAPAIARLEFNAAEMNEKLESNWKTIESSLKFIGYNEIQVNPRGYAT